MTAIEPSSTTPTRRRRRVLLLVFDGMRPGSIDARRMPNLAALAARGVTFTRSRTGFPSETMVGAGELMSGAYPERSGITSNWMPVPGSDSHGVELKSLRGIEQVRDGFGGRALASTSIFQALAGAGLTSAMVGKEGPAELGALSGADWAVSTGARLTSASGVRLERQRGTVRLTDLVQQAAGDAPEAGAYDDRRRSDWFVKAALAVDAAHAPDLLTVWFTDPDKTQHGHGLHAETQPSALLQADRAAGELLAELERRGELADMDVVITSDHGFSDHTSNDEVPLERTLRAAGLDVEFVIAAGNQHLVRFRHDPTPADFRALHDAIASSPFAQLVRTVIDNPRAPRAHDLRGDRRLTGRDLRQGSERAADAYVIYQRDDSAPAGPASVPAAPGSTVAGHGSLGWSDINNTLVVAGPDFERSTAGQSGIRTGNAAGIFDVAPTIAHLLGVEVPESMQGRVLLEALVGPAGPRGHVVDLPSHRSVAWTDVQLGARRVRTGLATERVGSARYLEALLAHG